MPTDIGTHLDQPGKFYRNFIKRPMDIVLAVCAIVVFSPVLLAVAVLIRIRLGTPVIFRQKRPGLDEKIFTMYKFRTMTDERDKTGQLLPDSLRLTKLGVFLRSTSLDELPELFNILRGDMSFVGPRPQLVRDIVFMTQAQRNRHNVRPGLTGWAQINGRNAVDWDTKLSFDLDYIRNITMKRDIGIVLMTLVRVLKRDGISTEGMATGEDLGDYLLRMRKINEAEYQTLISDSRRLIQG